MKAFDPSQNMPGGYSQNDGTVDFYGRVNALLPRNATVLDLGAGRAEWFEDDPVEYRKNLRLLKGKAAQVIAADIDHAVKQNQASDSRVIIEQGRVPVEDGTVDLIVADYVLEHVDDPDSFCREVDRILTSGGYFCARTPCRFSYVSVAARIVGNARHVRILEKAQPRRKAEDVFPTRYKLNSISDVRQRLPGYTDYSFVFRTDPAYYFGSAAVYRLMAGIHRVAPAALCGNLFVFMRKP